MPKKIFSFRLDEGLVASVDELCPRRGDRSEFVAAAIREKLGSGKCEVSEPVDPGIAKRSVKEVPKKAVRSKKNFDGKPYLLMGCGLTLWRCWRHCGRSR